MAIGVRTTRRRGSRSVSGIDFEGPFFTADLSRTVGQNVLAFTQRVAQLGEQEARARAYSAPRTTAGPSYSAGFIRGRTVALGGRRWKTTAVISADTSSLDQAQARRVQAVLAGRHNRITRDGDDIGTTPGHEGIAKVFSGTAGVIRRLVADIDLTKGLGG